MCSLSIALHQPESARSAMLCIPVNCMEVSTPSAFELDILDEVHLSTIFCFTIDTDDRSRVVVWALKLKLSSLWPPRCTKHVQCL